MGIEPTWDFVEPHAGFEDQERHQVAPHLHTGSLRRLPMAGVIHFRRAALQLHLDRFERIFQSELIAAHEARGHLAGCLICASNSLSAKPSAITR